MVTSFEMMEKIIELHLKGVRYGAIAKELNHKVTERTIGTIIRRYEKSVLEQQQKLAEQQQQVTAAVVPITSTTPAPVTGEPIDEVSNVIIKGGPLSYLINNLDQEEVDFDDVAFDDILSGDYDYDPRYDGEEGYTSSAVDSMALGGEPGSITAAPVIQQIEESGAPPAPTQRQPEVTVTEPEEEIDDNLREIQETINAAQRKYAQKNDLSIKNVMQMIVQDKKERKNHEDHLAKRELALKEGQEYLAYDRADFVQQQQNAAYEKQYTTRILEQVQPLWALYNIGLHLKIGAMSMETWAKIVSEKAQSRNVSADAAAISIRTELANYSRIGGVTKALKVAQYQLSTLRRTLAEEQQVADMVKEAREIGFSEKDIRDTMRWFKTRDTSPKNNVKKKRQRKKNDESLGGEPINPTILDNGNGKVDGVEITPIPVTIPDTSAAASHGDIS
jgi:hypothetical protein